MQRVSLLLCVLPLLTSSRLADAKLQKKSSVPKLWKTCKNIKCPPTEDPVCVNIKFRNRELSNKTTYIYMVNECELEYMKCHQDAEAVIVPNKHCEHNRKPNLNKAHKRLKRELTNRGLSKSNVTNTSIVSKAGQKEIVHRNKTTLALRSGDEDNTDTENDDDQTPQDDTDPENDDDRIQQDDTDTENDDDQRPQASDSEQHGYHDDEEPHSDDVKENNDDIIEHRSNSGSKNNDVECPEQCEIRGVMVCGKCQHGIYRTFLSPCHMRMFVCNNGDEEVELMSRYPCVLSVPYALPMTGLLKEPHDVDDVLRFIYCREAREVGSKKIIDPRCAHFKQQMTLEVLKTLFGSKSSTPEPRAMKTLTRSSIMNAIKKIHEKIRSRRNETVSFRTDKELINVDNIMKNIMSSNLVDELAAMITDVVADKILTRYSEVARNDNNEDLSESVEKIVINL